MVCAVGSHQTSAAMRRPYEVPRRRLPGSSGHRECSWISGPMKTLNSTSPRFMRQPGRTCVSPSAPMTRSPLRSEEHTSELQSRQYLVCRLLLEKKKVQLFFSLEFDKNTKTSTSRP